MIRIVTWAFAETDWNAEVGEERTNILTVDPKLWVSLAPPAGGGGKLPVKERWLALVM